MRQTAREAHERLANAVVAWLSGEAPAGEGVHRELAGFGLDRLRPLLKGARSKFGHAGWRTRAGEVTEALANTRNDLADWCLLGSLAHPSGYVREEAAALLEGRNSSAACAAAMFAADDHVVPVRLAGRKALRGASLGQLAERADLIAEEWQDQDRRLWRAAARERLGTADGRAALFDTAISSGGRSAPSALDLLWALHGVDSADAEGLASAVSWRVRSRIATAAVENEWVDVALQLTGDSRRLVRTALVQAVARTPGSLQRDVVRALFHDRSVEVRRVAAFYCRDEADLVAHCLEDLEGTGAARRLALASAVVVAPEVARATACRVLGSGLVVDRVAAVEALADTGGLEAEHLGVLGGEPPTAVRRAALKALDRRGTNNSALARAALLRAWAEVDGATLLPPSTANTVAAAPAVLRGLARREPWARRATARVERDLRRAAVEGWLLPEDGLFEAMTSALADAGSEAEEVAPRLVHTARRWVANHQRAAK